MKKLIIASFAFMLATSTILTNVIAVVEEPTPTKAPTSSTNARATIQAQKEENASIRATNIATRCSTVTTRVNTLTARYDQNRIRYVNRYTKLIEKLENLVNLLKEKNIETTTLEDQISTLKTMSSELNSLVEQTISKLNESKDLVCGQSEGEFLNKLQEAKSLGLQTRLKATEINNYFLTTVVAELQRIKSTN